MKTENAAPEKWTEGLSPRLVAALRVAYKHQDAQCDAVVREPVNGSESGVLRDRCIHLQREIVPELLAAADAVAPSLAAEVRNRHRDYKGTLPDDELWRLCAAAEAENERLRSQGEQLAEAVRDSLRTVDPVSQMFYEVDAAPVMRALRDWEALQSKAKKENE